MTYRRPSTESSDSFELISPPRRSSASLHIHHDLSSDEDQIVWNVMGTPISSPPSLSDDDFILLTVPPLSPSPLPQNSATGSNDGHSNRAQGNSSPEHTPSRTHNGGSTTSPVTPSRKNRRHRGHAPVARRSQSPEAPSTPKPAVTRQLPTSPPKKKKPSQKRVSDPNRSCPPSVAAMSPKSFGARSIVDDMSERGDDPNAITTALYEQAVHYINCFLSEPMEHKAAHLALLQALIIELGFFTPRQTTQTSPTSTPRGQLSPTPTATTPTPSTFNLSDLPHSMREAKSFIKANVFLNVREYIAVRQQGQEALQNVLHPSRHSLLTQLRKKSSRAPRSWVKQRGLNVFLISCH